MVAILGHLTRLIAGIPVPNSPIVNTAISFAHENLPSSTFNHVMRAWLYGQAIINHLPVANLSHVDQEAFAIGAILHDMGFSNNTEFLSLDKRFEVDGANVARSFLQREGGHRWNGNRQQIVWDSIALHGDITIAQHKGFITTLVAATSTIDFAGPEGAKVTFGDLITVTQEEFARISREFPRLDGERDFFISQLVDLCHRKPQTTWDNYVGDFGEKYLANYSRVGHRAIDLLEGEVPL